MATPLKIKFSNNTSIPATLNLGEVAYAANGNILYIGNGSAVIPIAGQMTPGTLTANQALVANSTSYLNVIKTANLYIGTVTINAINATSNSTQLGANLNSEIPTSQAVQNYVNLKTSGSTVSGSNTQIEFNDSGSFGASAGFTFNKTTNVVFSGNTFTAGANVILSTVSLSVGNSVANLVANSILVQVANATGVANLTPTSLQIAANVTLNTTSLNIGNTVANNFSNSTMSMIANSTGSANLTPTALVIGSSTVGAASMSMQDCVITGNLTVSGTLETLNATNLAISDPLIELANGNFTTDTVSIGVFGSFGNSTVTQYTGLYRDQANSGIWTLFKTQKIPTTTVDNSNTTYSIATLLAYLSSGSLVSNTLGVTLTANSTSYVNLIANNLTLSTALVVASGGSGLNTLTTSAVLVGNGTGPLTQVSGVDGTVMASVAGVPTFSLIDGGTF